MNEIKCPNCGKVFTIDESDYNSIVKQIKDHEFQKEIEIQKQQYIQEKESAVKLAEADVEKKLSEQINNLKLEKSALESQLKSSELEKESIKNNTKNEIEKEYTSKINELTNENSKLQSELILKDSQNQLAIKEAVTERDKNIDSLKSQIELEQKEYQLKEKSLKENYDNQLKQKEEMIEYYKDLKTSLSTKMVGETLEQHCNVEFNKLRPLFPNAYFEKDNDARTGSKGDFIYRDYDEDGIEIVSIMFEMKNESDTTATKHKNEDFFKELDKDRKEKGCEYAVLVSLLEKDNELYNAGITDVSYKYDKMYVIRPQSFISIITLLRSASLNALQYKKQLIEVRNTNIDIANFEDDMNKFKDAFSKNYALASKKFNDAIEEIDKSIDHLQKIKDALISSDRNLRLANDKASDLSIKRLVSKNKTMARAFADEYGDPEIEKIAQKLENKEKEALVDKLNIDEE
jgi:hypothetical protein